MMIDDQTPSCFILHPYTVEARAVNEAIILPAIEKAGYVARSLETIRLGEQLRSVLWGAISQSDVVIANLSKSNTNVLYELGVAQGLGKRTLVLSNTASTLPSSLSQQRYINLENFESRRKVIEEKIVRFLEVVKEDKKENGNNFSYLRQHSDKDAEKLINSAIEANRSDDISTAIEQLEKSIALLKSDNTNPMYASALNLLGTSYQKIGDYQKALESLEAAADLLKRMDSPEAEATVYVNLANVFEHMGHFSRAEELYRSAIEVGEQTGSVKVIVSGLSNLGYLSSMQGNFDAAEEQFKKALEIQRTVLGQNQPSESSTLSNLAAIYEKMGRIDEAETALNESLRISEQAGDNYSYARVLHNLASIYLDRGELDNAEQSLQSSIEIKERFSDTAGIAVSLFNLAKVQEMRGDISSAADTLRRTVELHEAVGDVQGLARAWSALGDISNAAGDRDTALRFFHRAREANASIDSPDLSSIENKIQSLSSPAS